MLVTEKDQVTIPKHIRTAAGVAPGSEVVFSLEGSKIVITPVGTRVTADRRAKMRAAAAKVRGSFSPEFKQLDADEIMKFTWSITAPCIVAPALASRVPPWKRICGHSDVTDFRRPPSALLTVGGTISGLGTGLSVVLRNTITGEDLSRNINGAFAFSTQQASGANYNAIVQTQPSGQACSIANGSGALGSANISTIDVVCATTTDELFRNGFE